MITARSFALASAEQHLIPLTEIQARPPQPFVVPTQSRRLDEPEVYRQMFSALDLDPAARVTVVGIVSAIRGEGRTTIASRLAMTLAADLDRQVSLIDMDLERPSIAQLFNIHAGPGACEVLEGTHSLDAVACPVARNLSVVPAGVLGHNMARLLRRLDVHDPFRSIDGLEGVLVLDLPPLLTASYGALAAQIADATLLVVRAGISPLHQVREALARLDPRTPHGIIVNDYRPALPRWWPGRAI